MCGARSAMFVMGKGEGGVPMRKTEPLVCTRMRTVKCKVSGRGGGGFGDEGACRRVGWRRCAGVKEIWLAPDNGRRGITSTLFAATPDQNDGAAVNSGRTGNKEENSDDGETEPAIDAVSVSSETVEDDVGVEESKVSSASKASGSDSQERTRRRRRGNIESIAAQNSVKVRRMRGYVLSDDLAAIVGAKYATRGAVMGGLSTYVRQRGLQSPLDRMLIVCDLKLRKLFNAEMFTYPQMFRKCAPHLRAAENEEEVAAVVEVELDDMRRRQEERNRVEARKLRRERRARMRQQRREKVEMLAKEEREKGGSLVVVGKSDVGRARMGGLHAPLQVSEELKDILGVGRTSRVDVMRELWKYIKMRELQDPQDRTIVRNDQKLMKVFAGEALTSMFSIGRHLNNHLKPLPVGAEAEDGASVVDVAAEEDKPLNWLQNMQRGFSQWTKNNMSG